MSEEAGWDFDTKLAELKAAGLDAQRRAAGTIPEATSNGHDDDPPLPESADDYGAPGETSATVPLDYLDAGDDDQPIPPRQWLLGNSFCRQFVSGIIGVGGAGKTSLRILQALALATGKSLSGEYIFRRSCVLIVCLEDGPDELRRRVRAAMKHHKVTRAE